MIQQQAYILNSILMVLDAVCVIGAGYGAYFIRSYLSPRYLGYVWSIETDVFVGSVMVVMFLNNYVMGRLHLYGDSRQSSYIVLLWSIAKALLVSFTALTAGIFIFKIETYSRLFLALFAAQSFVYIAMARIATQLYFDKIKGKSLNIRHILIVGDKLRSRKVKDILKRQMSWGHDVVGRLSVQNDPEEMADALGTIDDLSECLQKYPIDEVVFALKGDRTIDLQKSLDICHRIGVTARILPSLWEDTLRALSVETFQHVPFLTIRTDQFDAVGLFYKRVVDMVGGVIGVLLLGILYPPLALAIKLDSKGPVIFKQKRVGQHGRVFNLYKFRSMYNDAEARKKELLEQNIMQGAIFKMDGDPRVTRVGGWLRKFSLDEFPQLFNVLKGEMSLVGTRPPTLDEVEKYQIQHLRRIAAKPGVTGLWQISGRNKITDFNKIVGLDLKYLDRWTFLGDIRILLKTAIILFQRKGAM